MATLISIDDVKPLVNVRSTNAAYDQRLTNLVAAATQMIEGECRQSFTYAQRTELYTSRKNYEATYDFAGVSTYGTKIVASDQMILLKSSPVDEAVPVQVWYDPCRQFGPETQVDARYVFLDPDPINSRLLVNACTDQVIMGLKVQYSAGFQIGDDETLSADVQVRGPALFLATQMTVVHLWNRTNPDLIGTNEADENNKSRYATVNSFGIPKEAQAMLTDYRRTLTGRR